MTKVLNLDSIAKETRVLKLDGVSYPMKETSVRDYIELTKRAEEIEKKGDESLSTRIEFLVDAILMSFPTCSAEVLNARTFEELNAISEFARDGAIPDGTDDEGASEKKDQSPG